MFQGSGYRQPQVLPGDDMSHVVLVMVAATFDRVSLQPCAHRERSPATPQAEE